MQQIKSDNKKFARIFSILIIIFIALLFTSLCVGRFSIKPSHTFKILLSTVMNVPNIDSTEYNVIINLRLPRIFGAILVGASLAMSGTAYQGIFKNPLVSPDLLGVSNGASVGASIAILLGFSLLETQIAAFIMGIIAVSVTVFISRLIRKQSNIIVVLSGVIVSGFMLSVLGLLKYVADPETQLQDIVYWQMGSVAKVTFTNLKIILPTMLVPGVILMLLRYRLNLLSLGDAEAKSLGVNIKLERNIIIVCSTLLTASSVCLSGSVGWVGLALPHAARLLIGNDNKYVLPISTILSACFMLVIDTLARTLSVGELPIGILTGLVGAPFFVWLITRKQVGI